MKESNTGNFQDTPCSVSSVSNTIKSNIDESGNILISACVTAEKILSFLKSGSVEPKPPSSPINDFSDAAFDIRARSAEVLNKLENICDILGVFQD